MREWLASERAKHGITMRAGKKRRREDEPTLPASITNHASRLIATSHKRVKTTEDMSSPSAPRRADENGLRSNFYHTSIRQPPNPHQQAVHGTGADPQKIPNTSYPPDKNGDGIGYQSGN